MGLANDLRKAVLHAAIQGKLVPQDVNDEPASVLLEKIKAEKEQLIEENKIKKEKQLAPITEDEIPFDIPDKWEYVRLNDIIKISSGDGLTSKQMIEGPIPVYGGNGITGYHNKKNVVKPTLVIGRVGFYCGSIHITENEAWVTDNAFITDFSETNIDINFLALMLKAMELGKKSQSTAQPVVSGKSLYPLVTGIPPLAEQHRIVVRVEELMAKIDEFETIETELESIKEAFPDNIKKSLLQAAIQGKLTEQLSTDSSVDELLANIKTKKEQLIKENKIKKEKQLAPITEDEVPFDIPENWRWVRLGDVVIVNPRNNLDDNLEVSFIPMALLADGYRSEFTYEIRKWKDVKKGFTHFQENDIVFAKIVPCFQNLKSAVMTGLKNEFGAGTTELHVLRSYQNNICLKYLLWFIKNPTFVADGEKTMTGTAGQQRVSTDFVKNYLLPLPPFEEQHRIADKLDKILPYCEGLVE